MPTFNKHLYQKAYSKAFNGITEAVRLLETERIITEVSLKAVRALKELQTECEDIFLEANK